MLFFAAMASAEYGSLLVCYTASSFEVNFALPWDSGHTQCGQTPQVVSKRQQAGSAVFLHPGIGSWQGAELLGC